VQAVTPVAGDRQRFAAQGELHLKQVPGAVAQELQLPPVREGGGAEVA